MKNPTNQTNNPNLDLNYHFDVERILISDRHLENIRVENLTKQGLIKNGVWCFYVTQQEKELLQIISKKYFISEAGLLRVIVQEAIKNEMFQQSKGNSNG